MGSDASFVEFVVDQIDAACEVTYRQMFGGYTLYSRGKVVALICDNQLFVKPTEAGRVFIGDPVEAPAYPGARPSLLIHEQLDDRDWLSQLIAITERELPTPQPRRRRAGRK